MSTSTSKPPVKDPNHVPTAEDIDRQLGPFSRYARTVRGAARVAGLSARLTWTPSGWVEHLRLGDSLIGIIHLNKTPPTAEVGVSKLLEEALVPRLNNDLLKQIISKAEGTNIKWVEVAVHGPEPADALATLVTLKTELLASGAVPLSPAERTKPVTRPIPPHEAGRAPPATRRAEPPRSKVKAVAKAPVKAKKAAARQAKRAPARPARKVAKPVPKAKASSKRRR